MCAYQERECGVALGGGVTPDYEVWMGDKKLSDCQEVGISFQIGSSWLRGGGILHRKCACLSCCLLGYGH